MHCCCTTVLPEEDNKWYLQTITVYLNYIFKTTMFLNMKFYYVVKYDYGL